jgi:malonyl-CoA O-methyltransferase
MNDDRIKEKVKRSFNKAAGTYDQACNVQRQIGIDLINLLLAIGTYKYANVIDLGCGTGQITKILADNIKFHKFQAVDFAAELLAIAKTRLAAHKIEIIEADYDTLPANNFNLAFSNMALQWSLNLLNTIKTINNLLARNGTLAFSIPLHGTLIELNSHSINHFYSLSYVKRALTACGFKISKYFIQQYVSHFSDIFAALKSLKAVGANCRTDCRGAIYRALCLDSRLRGNDGKLTYNIGFFIAIKL